MSDTEPPEIIFLQNWDSDPDIETTWCIDQINDDDVKYIRFDLVSELIFEKRQLLEEIERNTIDDGFGNVWSAICPVCLKETIQVIRPGKAQCYLCG